MEEYDKVECLICGKKLSSINHTHLKNHNISVDRYREQFPDASIVSQKTKDLKNSKLKGKARSEATKKKISESNKKSWAENPNQGRTGCPLSEESKQELSEKMMGHKVTKETRKKIRNARIGIEPWNKKLTKEDHPSLQIISEKTKEWRWANPNHQKKDKE